MSLLLLLFSPIRCVDQLNKTGTSKVGAISKAQKAQNIFFGKKLEIFENFFLSKNVENSAEKNQKGGPFSLGRFCSLRLKSKKRKGGPFGEKKISKKSRTVPKKIERGDPLVPSKFVGNV